MLPFKRPIQTRCVADIKWSSRRSVTCLNLSGPHNLPIGKHSQIGIRRWIVGNGNVVPQTIRNIAGSLQIVVPAPEENPSGYNIDSKHHVLGTRCTTDRTIKRYEWYWKLWISPSIPSSLAAFPIGQSRSRNCDVVVSTTQQEWVGLCECWLRDCTEKKKSC